MDRSPESFRRDEQNIIIQCPIDERPSILHEQTTNVIETTIADTIVTRLSPTDENSTETQLPETTTISQEPENG